MKKILSVTACIFSTFLLIACASKPLAKEKSTAQEVAAMLDDWYDAANKQDGKRYFSHFSNDAIFMGTDPDEWWALSEFRKKYPIPSWNYVAQQRHVFFSDDQKIAWFDEKLQRTPDLGPMRATGVVAMSEGKWKIRQYNLTFLVPNEVLGKLPRNQSCEPIWTIRCTALQDEKK